MDPALPGTSMKLGRYVHKHELFVIFSLANQINPIFKMAARKSKMAAKINIKSDNGVLVSEKKTLNIAENDISGLFANK